MYVDHVVALTPAETPDREHPAGHVERRHDLVPPGAPYAVRRGFVVGEILPSRREVPKAVYRNAVEYRAAATAISGTEDFHFVSRPAQSLEQLDQPGRDDIALVAGKSGDDMKDSHGGEV